jgi:hypothetical protein
VLFVIIQCIALIVTDASFSLEGWGRDAYLGIKGQPTSISGDRYSEAFDGNRQKSGL